jgi:hypothetical protein
MEHSLEKEVRRLRRQVRGLGVVLFVGMLFALAGPVNASDANSTVVKAAAFEVIDSEGKVVATLGAAKDDKGTELGAELVLSPDGERRRVVLRSTLLPTNQAHHLAIFGHNDIEHIRLGADYMGRAMSSELAPDVALILRDVRSARGVVEQRFTVK